MEEKIRIIDELEAKVGGRFQLTALLQKRIRELVAGAPRLVDIRSDNPIDVAIEEVRAGKIERASPAPPRVRPDTRRRRRLGGASRPATRLQAADSGWWSAIVLGEIERVPCRESSSAWEGASPPGRRATSSASAFRRVTSSTWS
jgi:DNA-directed RNA polymerase subunit omega